MKLFRLMTYSLPLVALLWLPSSSVAQGAAQKPCGCTNQDKADLEQRIKRVEAAMKEYDALVQEWERKEKGTGESLLLNPTFRKSVQDSVWFKMKNIKIRNAVDYKADTDPTCKVTIDPAASACLRGALEDHEGLHKKECDKNKGKDLIDWRFTQRVVDYMKEEKAGYQKELERLNDELNKQKNCPKLDRSAQQLLEQAAAQQKRLDQAQSRVGKYTKSLK